MEALALLNEDERSSYEFDSHTEKEFMPGPRTFTSSLNFSRFFPSFRPSIHLARYSTFSLPPRYARFWLMFCNFLRLLLPSFIPASRGYQPATPARELHPTAWLDGLRGTAALLVVFHHTSHSWFTDRIKKGYGSGEDGLNVYLVQLPIIRLFIAGPPQVAIFFVVSGYAISYKPLKLMHSGRYKELVDSLGMSVFRRHTRLFLPATAVMLGNAFMTWMDWYGEGAGPRIPPHEKTLYLQIQNWVTESMRLAHPFNIPDHSVPAYDMNLWTLPVEFRNSMYLYGLLLGFCKLRPNPRLIFTTGVVMFCCYMAHWDIMLFLGGMLLADLRFRRSAPKKEIISPQCNCDCGHAHESSTPTPLTAIMESFRAYRRIIWVLSFILSLFVLSMPGVNHGAGTTPGYITLTKYIPHYYLSISRADGFWVPLAAIFLVFTIDNETCLQSIFETRFAQYLGKISFSLYMVHGPLLYTLGWYIHHRTAAYFGQDTPRHYGWTVVTAAIVLYPTMIWTADLVWRYIDAKAVKFGRWVGEQLV